MSYREYVQNFFHVHILKIAFVAISCGTVYGYNAGFAAVYNNYQLTNENCTLLETAVACNSVKFTKCSWNTSLGKCIFYDADCSKYPAVDVCKKDLKCFWKYDAKVCLHRIGFTDVKQGIYAAAMTVGGMFGSFFAGPLSDRFGRKIGIMAIGIVCIIGSILTHAGRASNSYAPNVIGRLLGGFASGMGCHVAITYSMEESPVEYRSPINLMFAISVTIGLCIAAAVGLICVPKDHSSNQRFEMRFQIFIGVQTLIALIILILGIIVPETKIYLDRKAGNITNDSLLFARKYTIREMLFPMFVALILSISGIITGIPAILSYAPRITKDWGINPLLASLIFVIFKFIGGIPAIILSKRLAMRTFFLAGLIIISTGNIIVAIMTTPGVATGKIKGDIAFFGVVIFIFGWQFGIGSAYYVMAQQLFPRSFRYIGGAYTNALLFFMNIVVNLAYPVAVTNLSGGPSGNQSIGQSIVFYFFFVCAMLSFPFLYFYLKPFEEHLPINEENNKELTEK